MAGVAEGQGTPNVLDTLHLTHTSSSTKAILANDDGTRLWIGEGGVLTFIDTATQAGFETPIKRVPIGLTGVMPVRMALDPEAALMPGNAPADLLYVAGGRHGLWVMEADLDPSVVNSAARVDDSGNTDPATQLNRRWCCEEDFMQLDGEWYLLALYQRLGRSRLRVYKLADVRPIATGPETGGEIAPLVQVVLGNHPSAPPKPALSVSGSIAMSMDLDVVDATPGAEVVDVYVAMGFHGLVRVRFTPADVNIPAPPQIPPAPPAPAWGPIFGDGSYYNTSTSAIPSYASLDWYSDFEFTDLADRDHPGVDIVDRAEFPLFADVAVENDSYGHYLYAAVDHLNWVRFDLDLPFDHTTPIDHHEGQPRANQPWGEIQFDLVTQNPAPATPWGFTRAIDIVEANPASGLGPILVVTANGLDFHHGSIQFTEGAALDTLFRSGGTKAEAGDIKGQARTIFYRIADGFQAGFNAENWLDFGGRNQCLPPTQNDPNTSIIKVLHNNMLNQPGDPPPSPVDETFMSLVVIPQHLTPGDAPLGPDTVFIRDQCDFLGRKTFSITSSIVDPDLLLFAGKDGGVMPDGFLATGVNPATGLPEIKSWYVPEVVCPDGLHGDLRGSGGIILGRDAQWSPGATAEYMWTNGRANPGDTISHWRITKMDVGPDPFTISPQEPFRWYITLAKDRFQGIGRMVENGASMSAAYDVHTRTFPGSPELAFITRHKPSAEGLVVVR
ncbi:MAG: hypothetical protein ACE5EL_03905, partial [Anaerolineae bacterium]